MTDSDSRDLSQTTKEMSILKDGIKPLQKANNNTKRKQKINKSLLLFKNDINIKRPKYFGRTKSLFFIGETPIFVLGESGNHL